MGKKWKLPRSPRFVKVHQKDEDNVWRNPTAIKHSKESETNMICGHGYSSGGEYVTSPTYISPQFDYFSGSKDHNHSLKLQNIIKKKEESKKFNASSAPDDFLTESKNGEESNKKVKGMFFSD